jgi:L-fuculose-phosphate aldolase
VVSHASVRGEIVDVCRRLYARGLISALEGNVSARLSDGTVLVTPAGVPKGELAAESLVVVDATGTVQGTGTPTSELAVHLRIYACRPDVGAVVHAHPPVATGFAVAGETIPHGVLPEVVVFLGAVALVEYAMPGTADLAVAVAACAERHDALLLAHHGAVTVGRSLSAAYCRMESLEHAARIVLAARLVGSVTPLPPEQVAALEAYRRAHDPAAPPGGAGDGRREG